MRRDTYAGWAERIRVPDVALVLALALAVLSLGVDYVTGPILQFPIVFILPIAIAARARLARLAALLVVTLPTARVAFEELLWTGHIPFVAEFAHWAVRGGVLGLVAYLIYRDAEHTALLAEEVRTLRGVLPICAHCKRIRDDAQAWHRLEAYITQHTHAVFSHGVCPECLKEHYGEDWLKE
jgi:hypothetical protein